MKCSYLCFREDSVSFLLPLESVAHIYSVEEARDMTTYGGRPLLFYHAGLLLIGSARPESHAVVLQGQDGQCYHVLLVEQVTGVAEPEQGGFKELPEEARGRENRFLAFAARLEETGDWAYRIELSALFRGGVGKAADSEEGR